MSFFHSKCPLTAPGHSKLLLLALGLLSVVLLPALTDRSGSLADAAVAGSGASGIGDSTPVILVVFDELPTANLMTGDGRRIDARRFPNFAAFANGATWYRDNATVGDFTAWAVPAIFSGQARGMYTLPVAASYPDNIFTLLGPGREIHSFEKLTELCPRSLCPGNGQGRIVGAENAVDFVKRKFEAYDPVETNLWIDSIPAGGNTLTVAHINSPHQPLRYTPEGKTYPGGPLALPSDLDLDGWSIDESGVAFIQQRHLIQTGYTDHLLGRIMRKIRSNGDYDRAIIVLTADHGISFDPDDLRRDATSDNVGAVVNPLLMVKYPRQRSGVISGLETQSIDVLPTIADRIGAPIPATEGVPVGDIPEDRRIKVERYLKEPLMVDVEDIRADRMEVVAEQFSRLGSGSLWRLGPRPDLIGRKPGHPPRLAGGSASLFAPGRIENADQDSDQVPALVSGILEGVEAGDLVALAWNGRIAGTTRAFSHQGRIRFGVMVPPSVMNRGHNRVVLYTGGPRGRLRQLPLG